MIAIWVKVRRGKGGSAAAISSRRSEVDARSVPRATSRGCARFNVLRGREGGGTPITSTRSTRATEAALEAHRAAPHYAVWRAAADTLDGPTEAVRCNTVFPAAADYWFKS